jgi:hypothetical protein
MQFLVKQIYFVEGQWAFSFIDPLIPSGSLEHCVAQWNEQTIRRSMWISFIIRVEEQIK